MNVYEQLEHRLDDGDAESVLTELEAMEATEDVEFHRLRGLCLVELGRVEEAIEAFSRWIEFEPDNPWAYYERAFAAHYEVYQPDPDEERIAQAVDDAERALELDSTFWEAHSILGTLLLERGRLDEAERHFDDAIAIAPDIDSLYSERALVHEAKGRPEQAWEDLEAAVDHAPPEHEFSQLEERGRLADDQNWHDRAIRNDRNALDLRPAARPVRHRLAENLEVTGELEAALEEYDRLVDDADRHLDARAFDGRARVREALGEPEGARRDRDRARDLEDRQHGDVR